MPKPIMVPFTSGIAVSDNYVVRITALDPATGLVVPGVKVSSTRILGTDVSENDDEAEVKPYATADKSYFVGDST